MVVSVVGGGCGWCLVLVVGVGGWLVLIVVVVLGGWLVVVVGGGGVFVGVVFSW